MPILKKAKPLQDIPRRRESDKPHPLRAALNVLGATFAVVGGFYVFNDHYASAADLRSTQQQIVDSNRETSRKLEINRLSGEIAVLQLRKSALNDRIYDLAKKGDRAGVDHYRHELAETSQQLTAKERLVDRLRTEK